MSYQFNPHRHVKIWFSNNPDVFMNMENQIRLIAMRETNPRDTIHLIYDSSLLSTKALNDLEVFCKEHGITPINGNNFATQLQTEKERRLYQFYKDEITHIKNGGNLAVASDIIRWISSVYKLGVYTDFDVPVDTTGLPPTISVDSPLLLNIGSLNIRKKEMILSNNDFIAIIDSEAAKEDIEKVQSGMLAVLENYTNNFIEKTVEELASSHIVGSFINSRLLNFMRNRDEAIYITRSKSIFPDGVCKTSRELREFINENMSSKEKYLNFKKNSANETHEGITQRLRAELKNQLGFIKWVFFRKEYNEIKNILLESDQNLISFLMKKERTLYLKSIVVCTTGPISIANALFGGYAFDSQFFNENIQQYSFNHYNLKKAFQSKNSLRMHENIIGMMLFLGAEDGSLNDSSWLENGAKLQANRGEALAERKTNLSTNLPNILNVLKDELELHKQRLEKSNKGFWGNFRQTRKLTKIQTLEKILKCFKQEPNLEFDISEFKHVIDSMDKKTVYSGIFSSRTKKLIQELDMYCLEAVLFGLIKNKKVPLKNKHVDNLNKEKPIAEPVDLTSSCAPLHFFGSNPRNPESGEPVKLNPGYSKSC